MYEFCETECLATGLWWVLGSFQENQRLPVPGENPGITSTHAPPPHRYRESRSHHLLLSCISKEADEGTQLWSLQDFRISGGSLSCEVWTERGRIQGRSGLWIRLMRNEPPFLGRCLSPKKHPSQASLALAWDRLERREEEDLFSRELVVKISYPAWNQDLSETSFESGSIRPQTPCPLGQTKGYRFQCML